ncbi:hypothetical protein B0H14DRAFT_2596791 [Mycena olivaceomarginata]|nr:hypothetical protein B0H14DRAFT_2596791 [Mycena olivaceomarginata]
MADSVHGNGCAALGNHFVFNLPILTQQKAYCADERRAGEAVVLGRVLGAALLLFRALVRHPLLLHHLRPAMDLPPLGVPRRRSLVWQILRWQVVMGRVEGKEGEMSLEAYPLSGGNAPSQQRCLRGGGHVSLLGDAMTEGEWERVRRGEQACATQGEGKVPPRDPGALEEVEWRGMFGCGTTLMWLSASYRTTWPGLDFHAPCAVRIRDYGFARSRGARRKHGSLVDGQSSGATLLDDERWGCGLQGKRGHAAVDENQPKGGKGCVTLGMRERRGGCNHIVIFNTVGLWRGHQFSSDI